MELMQTTEEDQPLVIVKFGRGGHYGRVKDLLEHLVPAIQKYNSSFEASSNNITKRLDVKGDGSYKIRAFPPLAYMLGLRANKWWTPSKRSTPYPCDNSAGVYNLFLYTDIVQYQPVGDSYSPLLSVVNVKGNYGDVVSITYHTVHYLRPHRFVRYYEGQVGSFLPGFYGAPVMYGKGIGSIFSRLLSFVSPLFKTGFAVAKPHLKTAATNIATDAVKRVMGKLTEPCQEGAGGMMGERVKNKNPGVKPKSVKTGGGKRRTPPCGAQTYFRKKKRRKKYVSLT